MSGPTPGPWEHAIPVNNVGRWRVYATGWRGPLGHTYAPCIAEGALKEPEQTDAENIANAHLIAAAPETAAECDRLRAELFGIRDVIPLGILRQHDTPGVTEPTDKLDLTAAVRSLVKQGRKLECHRNRLMAMNAELVKALEITKAALERENVQAIERCGLPTYSYSIEVAAKAIAKAKETP